MRGGEGGGGRERRWLRTNLLHFCQPESPAHILQHVGRGGNGLQQMGEGRGRDVGVAWPAANALVLTLFSLCSKP